MPPSVLSGKGKINKYFLFDLAIIWLTKKRDRHPFVVSVSFFVLRTKPNPLVRVEMCKFAEILFAQGVRIPRVQGTTRYCGSTEIYQEISTDLEIISSLSTRAPHSPSAFVSHIIGSASLRGSNTLASICSQRGTSFHEKQLSTVFPSLSVLVCHSGLMLAQITLVAKN